MADRSSEPRGSKATRPVSIGVAVTLVVILAVGVGIGFHVLYSASALEFIGPWHDANVTLTFLVRPFVLGVFTVAGSLLGLAVVVANLPVIVRAKRVSGPLQAMRLTDGRRELLDTLKVALKERGNVKVLKGSTSDYSTIPWFARALVRWSRVDIAGVVHDALYAKGEWPRREADWAWRVVAQAGTHHANPLQAWLGWLGLRAFGWWAWRKHRRTFRANG